MLRSVLIFGASALVAAVVPLVLRGNPELLADVAGRDDPVAMETVSTARPETRQTEPAYGRAIRLAADGRGHYTGTFKMNGVSVDGLVDTGATMVAINRATARRIGLKLAASDFVHEVSTANGKTKAAAATIERMEIGRLMVRDVPVAVLDDRALSATLVGMSFLKQLRRFESGRDGLLLEQ